MSRIGDLKKLPKYQLSLVSFLSKMVPENQTKYVETFLRIFSNKLSGDVNYMRNELCTSLEIQKEDIKDINDMTILCLYTLINNYFGSDNIEEFKSFCAFSDKDLLSQKNLSQYRSFNQVKDANSLVLDKLEEKELERQVLKVYEDDTWLALRPLTFESSCKYGAHTTWCTTSNSGNVSHYNTYTMNGTLIYIMNKKTDYKVAVHHKISKDDLTFWNQQDKRIDSLQTLVPMEILFGDVKRECDRHIPNCDIEVKDDDEDEYKPIPNDTPKSRVVEGLELIKKVKLKRGGDFEYFDENDEIVKVGKYINFIKEIVNERQ